MPPTLFPGSLASYVLVFEMDPEWHGAELYYKKPKKSAPDVSYSKLNMQPLVDKLRSADMIVRELYSSAELCTEDPDDAMPFFFALVSIGEKRQMTVAEIMAQHSLIRLRMRKMDDIGQACPLVLLARGGMRCCIQGQLLRQDSRAKCAPHVARQRRGTRASDSLGAWCWQGMKSKMEARGPPSSSTCRSTWRRARRAPSSGLALPNMHEGDWNA